ncbi:MAG TPA: hypothetical protein VNW26_04075 [Steroidobacteraceae bacterium]|nr:hypothetical protein [Steroidobacteraceae bacterium]
MRFIEVGDFGKRTLSKWFSEFWDAWTDERFARRESRKALDLYHCVHREQPQLEGRELYREIVKRCANDPLDNARDYVRHAEESFAAWPAERDVRFRDVVSYVVFDERVLSKKRAGTSTDIEAVVATVIPAEL